MTPEAWLAVAATGYVLALLMFTRVPTDLVMLSALTFLVLPVFPDAQRGWHGVLSAADAISGMSNTGMATVGVLFVVVAGLKETGALTAVVQQFLGLPRTAVQAQTRMMLPIAAASAFLNNTPLVAIMIPIVKEWAEKLKISVSQLMIPLSYAAMLGGMCTLIGTSTNLVVFGLLQQQRPEVVPRVGMFTVAWVGVPCAIVGVLYLLAAGRWLLPDRKPAINAIRNPREYTIEMMVEPGSPLAGKSVQEAGLRHLSGVYLVEIERGETLLQAVGPNERLQANDRLVFVGIVDSVKDLKRIRGLAPATDQLFKLDAPKSIRCLVEAVVSNTCPLVGKSIREGRFRTTYDAAVIAVARNGERVKEKVGDIVLRPGDTLLLETHPSFVDRLGNSRDFFLVSKVQDSTPVKHEMAWIALGILAMLVAGMTAATSVPGVDVLVPAMVAAGLMVVTRCCTASQARASVDWQLLLVIASSLGLAKALEKTGAANAVAASMIQWAGDNPWVALAAIYLVTTLFTEVVTNNAAAAIVFPIAMATAAKLQVDPMPFIVCIMIAASASFATPIGYQTNLMVYGPGGYRFFDYVRIGVPLNLLMALTAVGLSPLVWPFR
jgi:di/tricarboxylate transporter